MRSSQQRRRMVTALCAAAAVVVVAGCGAGSRTGAETAAKVACDFAKPAQAVDVDVLAYNSSAIDPFTNTMIKSCSKNDVTVKHEPIDFGGQVQKTTATLAGETGTYDVVETYGFVIPKYADKSKLRPLDDYFTKFSAEYGLDKINKGMREAMTYKGKLYAIPMQAQMLVMVYRKDVFDGLGLQPPKTFEDMRQAAKKIQDAGTIKYPIALPLKASADIVTAFDATLGSLGKNLTNPDDHTANLDSPESQKALEQLISLKPYLAPQVTTFDQPAVQQQLYNGGAAMAIMFSGRMNDLVQQSNSKFYDKFAFAAPPVVDGGDVRYNALSVDGWSIPQNTQVDPELLFELIAASVSEDASKAAIPAAYPARDGMVTATSSPYAAAAIESVNAAPPAEPYPWTSEISNQITPVIASVFIGNVSVADGTKQMQEIAKKVLADYR
ncbi:MAG TPA: sugar ABC transporter substrate-binding protein [Actinokineospora sp.]|nr:sugar ABC transporter substrate-binding protein [Actinokineospora sp.]